MLLSQCQSGKYYRRRTSCITYVIYVKDVQAGIFYYCKFIDNSFIPNTMVRSSSTILKHSDFLECDAQGNFIQDKELEMSTSDVDYIGGPYRVVKVADRDSNDYHYFKIDIDLDVKVNDLVVVENSNGLQLATVFGVYDNNIENASIVQKTKAWVVDIVDMTAQHKRKDATKKREYIIQQLEEKKAQMEAISVYEMLAKVDTSAAKLLDELKNLQVTK